MLAHHLFVHIAPWNTVSESASYKESIYNLPYSLCSFSAMQAAMKTTVTYKSSVLSPTETGFSPLPLSSLHLLTSTCWSQPGQHLSLTTLITVIHTLSLSTKYISWTHLQCVKKILKSCKLLNRPYRWKKETGRQFTANWVSAACTCHPPNNQQVYSQIQCNYSL